VIRLLFISCIFLLSSCSAEQHSQKVKRDNIKMLFGKTSVQQLFYDYPAWEKAQKAYVPDSAAADSIRAYDRPVKILVFFGTWCSDSRRNVPRFLKSVAENKNIQISFYAVDRKIKTGTGLAEKYGVKRVPTFIVLKDGKETGRIVEHPVVSIERDLLAILYP